MASPRHPLLRPSWEALGFWSAVLLPLAYYLAMIPLRFTFGDGPELLVAMLRGGVAHPSGYPLYTLLGRGVGHLPWATPHWNVAVFLSAVPSAAACGLLYGTLRRVEVHIGLATAAALMYGFSDTVVNQSAKVEVYALHCGLLAAVIYAVVRFAQGREARWAYLAVLAQCLALTNHLTSVFMVVPLVGVLIGLDPRGFFQPRRLGVMAGIAAGCALLYVSLPLAALQESPAAPAWNDPQTWERLVYHVRGAEYDKFRDAGKLWENLAGFAARPEQAFMPGALALMALGWLEGVLRRRALTLLLTFFMMLSLGYVSTYIISDISTYYGGLYLGGVIWMALGLDWLVRARLPSGWRYAPWVWSGVVAASLALPAAMAWRNRGEGVHNVLAEDMSASVVGSMPERAMIFTAVDGHTFPLWYQAYVNQPERPLVVIDRVLFRLPDKRWYRDFLRRRHPDVSWPSEEELAGLGGSWEGWVIERNRERYPPFAMLAAPWTVPGTYAVNRGWHFELRPNDARAPLERTRDAMHIYFARGEVVGDYTYFSESADRFVSGEGRVACVAEWWRHADMRATWRFVGPGGERIELPLHELPSTATVSWEYLEPEQQRPGVWTCEVEVAGRVELRRELVLE